MSSDRLANARVWMLLCALFAQLLAVAALGMIAYAAETDGHGAHCHRPVCGGYSPLLLCIITSSAIWSEYGAAHVIASVIWKCTRR